MVFTNKIEKSIKNYGQLNSTWCIILPKFITFVTFRENPLWELYLIQSREIVQASTMQYRA